MATPAAFGATTCAHDAVGGHTTRLKNKISLFTDRSYFPAAGFPNLVSSMGIFTFASFT
jgi:hypothetical protein